MGACGEVEYVLVGLMWAGYVCVCLCAGEMVDVGRV